MDLLLILAVLILGFGIVIIILLFQKKGGTDESLRAWLQTIDSRLDCQGKTINESLFKQTQEMLSTQRAIYSKLSDSAKTIGEMSEIGKSMKDLQQFLASPKLRGGLGERVLNQLLEQSLPKQSFHLQYSFRSGSKVDAAIKTSSGIIPIDSKFTMENFKKMMRAETEGLREQSKRQFYADIKDRIDEIARKYILTDEGTVDFALMYVPSESVYYEVVNSEPDLMAYAYKKRVMPVSPSTFYAFLRSVLLSFEGQQIASEIKSLQQNLAAIHNETTKFSELLSILQNHINNAYNMMSKVSTGFTSLFLRIDATKPLGFSHTTSPDKKRVLQGD